MNIMIFDTETTSLDKPFCYNVGYVILDTDTYEVLKENDYVCEQVWHNNMLFTTAYYSSKRDIYVSAMRSRKTEMKKFGYICQQMIRDIKYYNIEKAFAFNSDFDERVFEYNCDWFKCSNPFDNVSINDIRGFAHHFITNADYFKWCDEYERYTETGNYSSTAEHIYQYISGDYDFIEEHTALADSQIETIILINALENGADINSNYQAFRSLKKENKKHFVVKKNGIVEYETDCSTIRFMKSNNVMVLKD